MMLIYNVYTVSTTDPVFFIPVSMYLKLNIIESYTIFSTYSHIGVSSDLT